MIASTTATVFREVLTGKDVAYPYSPEECRACATDNLARLEDERGVLVAYVIDGDVSVREFISVEQAQDLRAQLVRANREFLEAHDYRTGLERYKARYRAASRLWLQDHPDQREISKAGFDFVQALKHNQRVDEARVALRKAIEKA